MATRPFVVEPGSVFESTVRVASRAEMLGFLHTQAAHDFRDSLNSMTINVELLSKALSVGGSEGSDTAVQERCLNTLRRELKRLAETTGRALEETRPERMGIKRVALGLVIESVLAILRRTAQRQGITVAYVPPITPVEVMGDSDELRLALFNVALNSIEAMPAGGSLAFDLTVEGSEALLAVSDTGSGIPDDVYPNVWDLFYSTKPQGLGLGLHVVRSIAAAHAGTVTLDRPGTGVNFRMRLPRIQ